MRKLIFLLSMLMVGSFAMAQNTATVYQEGTANNGNVTQTGGDNDATMDQYGSNIALVLQIGNSNKSDIDQGASGANVNNSHAPAYSGDWKEGAFIYQTGDDNEATIDVNVSHNGSQIDQLGNNNWAKQEVNSTYARTTNWDRMGLDINQTGSNNRANQKTLAGFGTYGVQGMKINQEGNYNVADQLSIGGKVNVTEIDQIGSNNNNPTQSGNTFDISSTGLASPLALSWNHKPAGDFTQYMFQNKGVTHMYVSGDNNNTFQYQEYVTYGGDEGQGQNDALMNIYGSENDVAQGQLGDLNSSDIDIDGDGNVVGSSQLGDSNIIDVDIIGSSNVAGVEQVGYWHNATISQTGNGNFTQVTQQQ